MKVFLLLLNVNNTVIGTFVLVKKEVKKGQNFSKKEVSPKWVKKEVKKGQESYHLFQVCRP